MCIKSLSSFPPLNIMYYLEIHHISKWNEVVIAVSCIKWSFRNIMFFKNAFTIYFLMSSSRNVVAFLISFIFKSESALEHAGQPRPQQSLTNSQKYSKRLFRQKCYSAWTAMNYMFEVRNHNQPSVENICLSIQASDITI